jgi:hypothetical protein
MSEILNANWLNQIKVAYGLPEANPHIMQFVSMWLFKGVQGGAF